MNISPNHTEKPPNLGIHASAYSCMLSVSISYDVLSATSPERNDVSDAESTVNCTTYFAVQLLWRSSTLHSHCLRKVRFFCSWQLPQSVLVEVICRALLLTSTLLMRKALGLQHVWERRERLSSWPLLYTESSACWHVSIDAALNIYSAAQSQDLRC